MAKVPVKGVNQKMDEKLVAYIMQRLRTHHGKIPLANLIGGKVGNEQVELTFTLVEMEREGLVSVDGLYVYLNEPLER